MNIITYNIEQRYGKLVKVLSSVAHHNCKTHHVGCSLFTAVAVDCVICFKKSTVSNKFCKKKKCEKDSEKNFVSFLQPANVFRFIKEHHEHDYVRVFIHCEGAKIVNSKWKAFSLNSLDIELAQIFKVILILFGSV